MEKLKGQAEAFCRKYLQCMDPDQAAAMAGCADGYAVLETKMVRRRLERMREAAAGQVHREDVVRRLAQLAFGRVNDAARLALHSEEAGTGFARGDGAKKGGEIQLHRAYQGKCG